MKSFHFLISICSHLLPNGRSFINTFHFASSFTFLNHRLHPLRASHQDNLAYRRQATKVTSSAPEQRSTSSGSNCQSVPSVYTILYAEATGGWRSGTSEARRLKIHLHRVCCYRKRNRIRASVASPSAPVRPSLPVWTLAVPLRCAR